MTLLEIKNLSKRYGPLQAVNNISFSIAQGSCFGLLGPNGAGKTTTIEMIEGITPTTSGEILFQNEIIDKQFKKKAGIQFQQTALPDYLSTLEVLNLFKSFYSKTLTIEQLVSLCDLDEFLDTYATQLSGGQRQRLLLALALINDPVIVFLDEPTTGLDPRSRRKFWELIKTIKNQGKTILLTTHYMEEAEFLCDSLVIMDHGNIIAQGSPQSLLKQYCDNHYISLKRSNLIDESNPLIAQHKLHAQQILWLKDECHLYSSDIQRSLSQLLHHKIPLNDMRIHQPNLEDLFLKLTGNSLT